MLKQEDILSTKKWLNDIVVNAFLKLFKTNSQGRFDFLDPLFIQSKSHMEDYIPKLDMSSKSILIPLCVNKHWTLLVFQKSGVFSHFDSICSKKTPSKEALEFLKILEKSNYFNKTPTFKSKRTAKQAESWECGYMTLMVIFNSNFN